MALYFDFVQKKASVEISDKEIIIKDSFFTGVINLTPRKLLQRNIETIYSDKNVNNLIDAIITEKPIYKDVKVLFSLSDHDSDQSKYWISYEVEFTSNINEYVIALVNGKFLQNQISNRCNSVCEILSISTINSHNDVQSILDNIKLSRLSKGHDGNTREIPLLLSKIERKLYKKHLINIPESEYCNILLLHAVVEKSLQGLNTFILETPPVMSDKTDHYVYWVSDRPMWVHHIEFNTSAFTYNSDKNFTVQPLLINYHTDRDQRQNKNKIVLNIHNWIANGHGAILSWS